MIDVNSQDLAQQRLQILAVSMWIVASTAVANGDVKETVGTEADRAPLWFQ